MWEIFRQVTFAVAVMISAIAEIVIAVIANVLSLHTHVLTFHLLPTLITPEISVIIMTISHLLTALIANMLGYVLMGAIDDSVATVTVVILVLVYVIANEFSAASVFIAVAVTIIVTAPDGYPYSAIITGVVIVIICMIGVIGVFSALGFLTANVTRCVFILVNMIVARKLSSAVIAEPIAVSIYANVRHPTATLVTEVVTVLIDMLLSELLHTVSWAVAFLTSSVIIPVEAIVAQPKLAKIAEVIVITVIVHKIVILVAPVEIFEASVAEGVLVFIHVLFTRNLIFTNIAEAVAVLVYTGNGIPAYVTSAIVIIVCTHIVETGITDVTFMGILTSDHTHIRQPYSAFIRHRERRGIPPPFG